MEAVLTLLTAPFPLMLVALGIIACIALFTFEN